MRSMFYLLSAVGVMALAFWAYEQNYRTQEAISEVRALHREIGLAHERLGVLRAEWAYLNRPERLRDLAEMNFERLELLPLMPEAFGRIDQVSYPLPPLSPIIDPIEVSSDNANGEEFP
ncbi:hypothetical protein OG2516_05818 [Oceanicola granulosus HTCC2516]|uniref:Cell division protein FtsL n=1 Tax=Oceanicola granulosus (strain ATCC BAA-861 / DSM 15982 / KCTC 12143 / HTCC2516) TaxID=314256 RepID=Q2CII8_OCEGH|nr:hypothetical protein [Oceanicola granulosus]EAR52601.1 hypothetical protein OG2516_05818 [Oceanicola granulosus HTCC2516]